MKARIVNGKIQIGVPKIFNGITGTYPGGFDKQPDEILQKEGFYDVVKPEYDPFTQKLGEIYFDKESEVFTYPVEKRTDLPTLEDAKAEKVQELKMVVRELYQSIQWYIEMNRIENNTISKTTIEKIKQIKLKYEDVQSQITSLTTVVDVIKYKIPYSATDKIRADLESIV